MDKYPENFNRKTCMDIIAKNQNSLVKIVRKEIYDKVSKALETCDIDVKYNFPEKLWYEHKVTLIKELIDNFGKVKVKTTNSQCEILKLINDTNDIPRGTTHVIIEFVRDD